MPWLSNMTVGEVTKLRDNIKRVSDLLIAKEQPDLWRDLRQGLRRRWNISVTIFPREGFDGVVDAVDHAMESHDYR